MNHIEDVGQKLVAIVLHLCYVFPNRSHIQTVLKLVVHLGNCINGSMQLKLYPKESGELFSRISRAKFQEVFIATV